MNNKIDYGSMSPAERLAFCRGDGNNQMVSVPRELLQRAIDQLSVCSGPGPANRAQEMRVLLAKPAEQHQGEPVALPARLPMRSPEDRNLPKGYAQVWNACLDEIAKLGPLYTHADPAEVERLRAGLRDEIEAGDSWKREAEDLRSQLAEAHALLREVAASCYEAAQMAEVIERAEPLRVSTTLMAPARDFKLADAKGKAGVMKARLIELGDALSASAEPSPDHSVEADNKGGRNEFVDMVDAAMLEMGNIYPPLKRSECERLIRAALERNP